MDTTTSHTDPGAHHHPYGVRSSMVEHRIVIPAVTGSSPAAHPLTFTGPTRDRGSADASTCTPR